METVRNYLIWIRQSCKRLYASYSTYLNIAVKWAISFAAFLYINHYFPGRGFLLRSIVVIAVSLLCSVLPWSYISLMAAIWLLAQLSAISLEVTAFVLVVLLVLALLRYLMLPGAGVALVLLPIFFIWRIPFVIPVVIGLAGTLSGFVTVGSGVIIYYLLRLVSDNLSYFTDPEGATIVQQLLFLTENFGKNETMLTVLGCFCLTTLLVYFISRASVPYADQIAIGVGVIINPCLLAAVFRALGKTPQPPSLVWGSLCALVCALVFSVFYRFLDHAKTEHVQFEDDEYYYYVKAVPKVEMPEGLPFGGEQRKPASSRKKLSFLIRKESESRKEAENRQEEEGDHA